MRPSQKRTLPGSSRASLEAMSAEQHRRAAPSTLGFSILTVSDTREKRDDASGDAIRERVAAAGHRTVDSTLVRDDVAAIRDAVRRMLAHPETDVVVVTGGTGFSPRDVTLDAVGPLFDQPV